MPGEGMENSHRGYGYVIHYIFILIMQSTHTIAGDHFFILVFTINLSTIQKAPSNARRHGVNAHNKD